MVKSPNWNELCGQNPACVRQEPWSGHSRLLDVKPMKTVPLRHGEAASKTVPMILRYIAATFAICIFLAGCQCKQQGETTTHPDISGSYNLATINGNTLPYTPPHQGGAPLVTSGTFTIKPDGNCTSKILFALPSGKSSSREVSATYKQEANKLNMQWHGAGRTIGTLEGDTFTMNNEGAIFIYRR